MPEMKMSYWQMIKQTFAEWSEDKATRLSAALAFYTMLSLGPLLILTLKIVSKIYVQNPEAGRAKVEALFGSATGGQATGGGETKVNLVTELINNAGQHGEGFWASVISGLILLFSASGVFGELQNSMNTIWEVKPKAGRGIMGIIKDRFFSFTLVIGTAFLLLVSLVISAVLTAISERVMPGQGWLWQIVNVAVSLAVITGLFALMFKYLPDVKIGWRPVLVGAALTAILFTIGKQLLSWYFARGATGAYGTFGSLVAVLLWVYYTGQIVFLGAEFTQVYARATGERIITSPNAVSVREEDEAMQAKSGATPAGAGEDKQTGGGEPSSGGAGAGAGSGGSGAGAGQPWYPAVPVNYNLAVSSSARVSGGGNGSSTTGKLVPLAIGVAVGKFILGRGKKTPKPPRPQKQFAFGRVLEPGWSTRKRYEEEKEITIHVRPPEFVRRAGDRLSEGYERVKKKVREYTR
jgi:membrane protein